MNLKIYLPCQDNQISQQLIEPFLLAFDKLGCETVLALPKMVPNLPSSKTIEINSYNFKENQKACIDHKIDMTFIIDDMNLFQSSRLNQTLNLKGLKFDQVINLISKSRLYGLMDRLNIPTLKWIVPKTQNELETFSPTAPIFVKPSVGVNNIQQRSYDYKSFENSKIFTDFLIESNQIIDFLNDNNASWYGGHVIQQKNPSDEGITIHGISVRGIHHTVAIWERDSEYWDNRHYYWPSEKPLSLQQRMTDYVYRLLDAAQVTDTFFSVQCYIHENEVYVIDFNVRMGEVMNLMSHALGWNWHYIGLKAILTGDNSIKLPTQEQLSEYKFCGIRYPDLTNTNREIYQNTDKIKLIGFDRCNLIEFVKDNKTWGTYPIRVVVSGDSKTDANRSYNDQMKKWANV